MARPKLLPEPGPGPEAEAGDGIDLGLRPAAPAVEGEDERLQP